LRKVTRYKRIAEPREKHGFIGDADCQLPAYISVSGRQLYKHQINILNAYI